MTWRPAVPDDFAYHPQLWSVDEPFSWVGRGEYASDFRPDFTPGQMTRMGVFGDAYFGGPMGEERWAMLEGFPRSKSGTAQTNIRGRQCRSINYHGKRASLPRLWWLQRGLIADADPLGWFEWFHWYHAGRRAPRYDRWQIERWHQFKMRHLPAYRANPTPGRAQALLHWGVRAWSR